MSSLKRQITGRSKNQGVEGQEVMTVQLPLPLLVLSTTYLPGLLNSSMTRTVIFISWK